MNNLGAASDGTYFPDALNSIDDSWLAGIGLADTQATARLKSSHGARRTLQSLLAKEFDLAGLSSDGAAALQFLSAGHQSARLARWLGACAVVNQLRRCIDGPVVVRLRHTLSETFMANLCSGRYQSTRGSLLTSEPGLPQNPSTESLEHFFLSLGKALLLEAVPATEVIARQWVELALPIAVRADVIEPRIVNPEAVQDCITALMRDD